jgi:hypothetical protein
MVLLGIEGAFGIVIGQVMLLVVCMVVRELLLVRLV